MQLTTFIMVVNVYNNLKNFVHITITIHAFYINNCIKQYESPLIVFKFFVKLFCTTLFLIEGLRKMRRITLAGVVVRHTCTSATVGGGRVP